MREYEINVDCKIAALTIIETEGNELFGAICSLQSNDAKTVISAHTYILRLLALSEQSLSEYLHDLIVYGDYPLMRKLNGHNSSNITALLKNDITVIKDILEFCSHTQNELIRQSFICLPTFEVGSFDFDTNYFIEFGRENGFGIFAKANAFLYENGRILPVQNPDEILFSDLKEYKVQINQVRANTEAFIKGYTAQNALLYGDRGTGKSSTVKALANEYPQIRIIGMDKNDIADIGNIYNQLSSIPLNFILFLDDLTFEPDERSYHIFKQLLEGSLVKKPQNILIYATTNRRHFVKEAVSDRDRDVFHRGDDLDDIVSLADRFGLYLTFSIPNKDLYLRIVKELAADAGIITDENQLFNGAESFALKKGGRSPRIAKQYIEIISVNYYK